MGTVVSFWPCLASLIFAVMMVFFFQGCNATEMGGICNPPSSCGSLLNISYPFRLKTDPINCGLQSFELSCESNRTFLYLNKKKFFVAEISYNQGTIRIVDSGLERDNCSSLPSYYLTSSDYLQVPLYLLNSELLEVITYANCSVAIDSPYYIATAPCVNISSMPYFYVIVGSRSWSELNENCTNIRTSSVYLGKSSVYLGMEARQNLTYTDIRKALLMGFNLKYQIPSIERPFRSTRRK